jgi:hypothetical protein
MNPLTIYADTGYAAGAFNPQSFPFILLLTGQSMFLSWAPVPDAVSYTVYTGTRDDNMIPFVSHLTTTTATVTGLNLTAYAFKIVAELGDGRSISSYLGRLASYSTPQVSAVAAAFQVQLNITEVFGAIGYNVYLGTASGQEIPTPLPTTQIPGQPWITQNNAGVLVQGLTNGTTYYFLVQPIFKGWLGACTEVNATPAIQPPAAPTSLTAVACDGRGQLAWTGSIGASSYNVYQATAFGGPYTKIITGLTSTNTPVGSLTDGTTYYYEVTAVGPGGESSPSNIASIIPFQLLAPSVTPTPGIGQITLSFTSQQNVNYAAYMGTTPGGETGVPVYTGVGSGGTLNWPIIGLTSGTTYYFKVVATNLCSQTQTSTEISATVPGDPFSSDVVALLHFDGINGSTIFTDTTGRHIWTANGSNAALSTAQAKFGPSSLSIPDNASAIECPTSTDFDFGTGDYTVEGWVYVTSYLSPPPINQNIRLLAISSSGDFYTWEVNSGNTGIAGQANIDVVFTAFPFIHNFGGNVTVNTWHHIAFSQVSQILYAFIDGVLQGTVSTTGISLTSPHNPGDVVQIVGPPSSLGYVDEVRVTKGVGRYTANFTPPTAPFPYP